MSRSRKKTPIAKDSGSKPWMRRLTRSRMKTAQYESARYTAVIDTWNFSDHSYREWDSSPHIRAIREKYEKERQRIAENRHPLCFRMGRAKALQKIDQRENRELFQFTKRFKLK